MKFITKACRAYLLAALGLWPLEARGCDLHIYVLKLNISNVLGPTIALPEILVATRFHHHMNICQCLPSMPRYGRYPAARVLKNPKRATAQLQMTVTASVVILLD